jgi:hypothetical protein
MKTFINLMTVAAALSFVASGCENNQGATPSGGPSVTGTNAPGANTGAQGTSPGAGRPGESMGTGQPSGPGQNTGMNAQGTGAMATADAGADAGGLGAGTVTGTGQPTGPSGKSGAR